MEGNVEMRRPSVSGCLAALAAAWACAAGEPAVNVKAAGAPPAPPEVNREIREIKDPGQYLLKDTAGRPHVLFVNVGGALEAGAFETAAANARLQCSVNVAVAAEKEPFAARAVAGPAWLAERFGRDAALVVAVVDDERAPGFVAVPGWFAQVNLRGLGRGAPDARLLDKRRRQMLLKGLAMATGAGATLDRVCVMHWDSFSVPGMDYSSATFGPYASGPMMRLLDRMCGGRLYAEE
jgi:hypothetical protein